MYFQSSPYISPYHVLQTKTCLTNINQFEKLKILGTGDVGRVYLVKKKLSETTFFALKVLSKEEMLKRNKLRRVVTELNILSTVHHPFIVQLYHAFETSTHFYLCLEYCAGGDIHRLLRKHRTLSEPATRFFVMEIMVALEYLHFQGILYRDLKPENVLLHGTGHIKLTDFDLSCYQARSTHSLVGTEAYLAPEIVSGELSQSWGVDGWTLGIFMYECLFGITPFMGKDIDTTFNNIVHAPLKFPPFSSSFSSFSSPSSSQVSSLALQVMQGLLQKSTHLRWSLPQLKSHPWFLGHSFTLIRHQTPPYLPPTWIELEWVTHSNVEEFGSNHSQESTWNTETLGWINASWIHGPNDPLNE
ncbi:hypothetical protein HMI54_009374 [Coelomomyces lativittatus]|nr:hypothetical protein HMI54_009374 [Coelomomyces lativittatus]